MITWVLSVASLPWAGANGVPSPCRRFPALLHHLIPAAASGSSEHGGGAAQLLLSHIADDLEAAWHWGW